MNKHSKHWLIFACLLALLIAAAAYGGYRYATALAGGDIETHSIPAHGLGSEAPRGILLTYDLERFGKVTTSIYVWRRGPVVAWVIAGHPPDDTDGARTLELARNIDSRIAR